jgi:hypothetical protein
MRCTSRVAIILLPVLMLAAAVLVPQTARAGTFVIFQENFEGDWPGPWLVGDDNLDAGADYWGVSGFREAQGKKSAWAAQEGKSSKTGLPNTVSQSQDDSMDAYMRVDLGSLGVLDAVSLSFKYWIEAGSGDVFRVRVSDGMVWTTVWSLSGPVAQGWTEAEVSLPLSVRFLEFRYVTADTHDDAYEGVYVDKVEVLGEDSTPPDLSVLEPAEGSWVDTRNVLVGWTVTDSASGVAFVEVRLDEGAWINLGDANSYLFQNLSEGAHSVTLRAVDAAGNAQVETLTFGVDTTAPSIVLQGPEEGSISTSSTVEVSWTGGDAVSAVAYYEVRLDDGPWVRVSGSSYQLTGVVDGVHEVSVRAMDLAGNSRVAETSFVVNTNPLHPDGPGKGALLYGLIGAGLLGVAFTLHRREKINLRAYWSKFKGLFDRIPLRRRRG